jgi:hypothetical protein
MEESFEPVAAYEDEWVSMLEVGRTNILRRKAARYEMS